MNEKVIIHLKGGGSYETTEHGLPNAQRMMAGKIKGIERENDSDGSHLENSIDEDLVIEVSEKVEETTDEKVEETRFPTLEELEGTDKDVLRKMADDLAIAKEITKANGRSGVKTLAKYIFENQNK